MASKETEDSVHISRLPASPHRSTGIWDGIMTFQSPEPQQFTGVAVPATRSHNDIVTHGPTSAAQQFRYNYDLDSNEDPRLPPRGSDASHLGVSLVVIHLPTTING
ncbi:hypothetical protein BHE90_003262 [Fusarium euwallaceae]|uniref:Uncharacterized protein n=2 Tax=Fusarium solani species complex TaxID=232080 RepID=A0A3M2RSA9_9HYPO|nr:hypothetical protein CDV36_012210 [Fusarium kuroshium]RTE82253.1 hypothetical protein BHE90_003262 [Fusarium euwallaceae]